MSIGKLRFGKTTPNIFFFLSLSLYVVLCVCAAEKNFGGGSKLCKHMFKALLFLYQQGKGKETRTFWIYQGTDMSFQSLYGKKLDSSSSQGVRFSFAPNAAPTVWSRGQQLRCCMRHRTHEN